MKWLLMIAVILIVGILILQRYEVVWVPPCSNCKTEEHVNHEAVGNTLGNETHRWKCGRCNRWL